MTTRALSAADLNARLLQITPNSADAERLIDDMLGLALCAFDLREISEAEFRDLAAQCLDSLTGLAR